VFKIGDFSRLSFVTVKALHHYDDIGLLKPVRVDRFTGYRYYSADQLPRLNYIIALKQLGLSLEEIATLVNENLTPSQIREIFLLKKAELRQKVSEEQRRLEQVEKLLMQIEKEGKMPDYQVVIKNIKPQLIASIRTILPNYGTLGQLYGELFGYLSSQGITIPAGPTLYICHDQEFKESDVDVEAGVPIAKAIPGSGRIKVHELSEMEEAACTVYKGPYENIGEAYSAIMKWIEDNGYQITGPDRELYLVSPADTQNPAEYVTEIQFPVKKA
jgi:effector-binding domain-containing protein